MKINEMTILVTGAAGGIGRALCLGFLADGAAVIGADRREQELQVLAERGAVTCKVDVAVEKEVEHMIQAALKVNGRLDVLINNAGVGFRCALADCPPGQFEDVIRINLLGPVYGMRATIPLMRRQGFGRIINLVSRAPEVAGAGMSAYGASKAALWAATRHVAKEVADADILINGLIPGPTKSGMMPRGQDPSLVYPTARMLATLPGGGPSGKVFWNEVEYRLFDPQNEAYRP